MEEPNQEAKDNKARSFGLALRFIFRRLLVAFFTFVVLSSILYAVMMTVPLAQRVALYEPRGGKARNPQAEINFRNRIIEQYGLDDPFIVQYPRWLIRIFQGEWGWSPLLREEVFSIASVRAPVTIELTLYSLLLIVPAGILGGAVSGWYRHRGIDKGIRLGALLSSAVPSFVLAIILLGVFYAALGWFPPSRASTESLQIVGSPEFKNFTGLISIDAILNKNLTIFLDAIHHLILPSLTLAITFWAPLNMISRQSMIEERRKEYITAAFAKGLTPMQVFWRHALKNILLPGITNTSITAASLVSGVYVVEVIFNYHGISEMITMGMTNTADIPLALGFCIYSIFMILGIMLLLDLITVIVDPRIKFNREAA